MSIKKQLFLFLVILLSGILIGCQKKEEVENVGGLIKFPLMVGGGPTEWVKDYARDRMWKRKNEGFVDDDDDYPDYLVTVLYSIVNEENGKLLVYSAVSQGVAEEEKCTETVFHDCPRDLGVQLVKFELTLDTGNKIKLSQIGKSEDIVCSEQNCSINTFKMNTRGELAWIIRDGGRTPCFVDEMVEGTVTSVPWNRTTLFASTGQDIIEISKFSSEFSMGICEEGHTDFILNRQIFVNMKSVGDYFDLQIDEFRGDEKHTLYTLYFDKDKNKYQKVELTKLKNSPM